MCFKNFDRVAVKIFLFKPTYNSDVDELDNIIKLIARSLKKTTAIDGEIDYNPYSAYF